MSNPQITNRNARTNDRPRPTAVDSAPGSAEAAATPAAPEATAAAPTEAGKKSKAGAPATMPGVVVYEHGGKTHAEVISPTNKTRYRSSGKGRGSAIGGLEDVGFTLSGTHMHPPSWLTDAALLPEGATVLGYCTISGFPLPAQD